MEPYIQISKINDFLYCPVSLYLHTIYENFDQRGYHKEEQVAGKIMHKNIDKGEYSSAKRFLQGIEVYSEKYGIAGRIDIYDKKEKSLIERKNKINNIYDGYKLQLYAQFFCLKEMGYQVEFLYLHSLSDNKRYPVDIPNEQETVYFENILSQIKNFSPEDLKNHSCPRCQNHIYNSLIWR